MATLYARRYATLTTKEGYCGIGKDSRGKSPFGYVLKSMMKAIADVRNYGNTKYTEGGSENWRTVPADEYYHALARHVACMMDAHFNSKSRESDRDAESGLLHAAHAATNLMFILELIDEANYIQDIELEQRR